MATRTENTTKIERALAGYYSTTYYQPGSGGSGVKYPMTDNSNNQICATTTTSRTSTTTPGYHAIQKSGGTLPVNDFSFTRTRIVGPIIQGVLIQRFPSYPYYTENIYMGVAYGFDADTVNSSVSAAQVSSLDNSVITGLRLKMKDQHVNLVQMYAERKQTADLFADTALKLTRAISAVRKGDIVGAAKAVGISASRRGFSSVSRNIRNATGNEKEKQISRAWLALQYGWKPLLDDCYGAAEQIAQANTRNQQTRVSRTKSITENLSTSNHFNESLVGYWSSYETAQTVEIKYVLHYSVPGTIDHLLSQIGVTNPAMIAWELMPWSFVIDWFLPVGNFINQLDATAGLQFVSGSKTTFSRTNATGTRYYNKPLTPISGGALGVVTKSTNIVSVNRVKILSFPTAGAPSFKNPFSFQHLANAMALLSQLRLR